MTGDQEDRGRSGDRVGTPRAGRDLARRDHSSTTGCGREVEGHWACNRNRSASAVTASSRNYERASTRTNEMDWDQILPRHSPVGRTRLLAFVGVLAPLIEAHATVAPGGLWRFHAFHFSRPADIARLGTFLRPAFPVLAVPSAFAVAVGLAGAGRGLALLGWSRG
jgi:hypothetical protein